LQTTEGVLLSCWDNAPYHREVVTLPDRRHDDHDVARPNSPMDPPSVLNADNDPKAWRAVQSLQRGDNELTFAYAWDWLSHSV
jgi:hypothetical protein